MEITKLEKAVRQAARADSARTILTDSESQGDPHLPSEFDTAAKTMAKRRAKKVAVGSILNTTTAQWL